MQNYAEDASALLDALGWHDALVVGFPFGGMVAQELSIRYPEKVRALALISTTSGGQGGSSYPIHEFADSPPEKKARRALEVSDLRFSADYKATNPELAQQAVLDRLPTHPEFMQEPGSIDARDWQLDARARHDCYDRLAQITAPTLVIGGEFDGQAHPDAVSKLAQAIPDATLAMLPGAHGLIFENDAAFEAVIAFFDQAGTQL